MAKKILIAVALLAMVIICCHIESVSGGEMGGHAKKRSSYSSSSTRRRIRSHHHSRQSWVTPKPANSSRSLDRLEGDTDWMAGVSFCLFFLAMALYDFLPMLFGTDSVLVFQVAFQGATGRICQDLDLISDAMDASLLESHSPRCLHLLLSETVSCLCRYGGESCFSAYPNVNKKWRLTGGWKKSFDLVCNVERKKQDAHVNVNHRYVIVTILVAANCKYELPAINCYSELESALRALTSIKDTQIEAIKVFWTSRDDMEDFTSLIPI